MQKITIVSLGQSDESQLTLGAYQAIQNAKRLVLRTGRHPVADYLKSQGIAFETLDDLYDQSADFDALNSSIVKKLLTMGDMVYAVPHGATDESVFALIGSGQCDVTMTAGVGAAEAFFTGAMLPVSGAYRVMPAIDAKDALLNPREPLLVTELNSAILAGEVKLWLTAIYNDDMLVRYTYQNRISTIPLYELDRQKAYDHTSAVYLEKASMLKRQRHDFQDLIDVMNILCSDNGCPWDKEQTHQSLEQYLIEEAYETIAAIEQGDMDHVYDELGDVMLQVVFHANIAKRHGEFDIHDVTSAIVGKMISRHAHIFGTDQCDTADEVLTNWEKIKKAEKGLKSYTDLMTDIPASLPALMRASKVQNKAKQVGFDFDNALHALEKVFEEAQELKQELQSNRDPAEEMGDLLFSCVNVARKLKIQPELCLASATDKFINRFSNMENEILLEGKSLEGLTLHEMDVYWERGKNRTK